MLDKLPMHSYRKVDFDMFGKERQIMQSWPQGYTLYELNGRPDGKDEYSLPMASYYTGKEYHFDLFQRSGRIGFTSQPKLLESGTYLLEVTGFCNVEHSNRSTFGLGAFWEIPGVDGLPQLPDKPIMYNGQFKAFWPVKVPKDSYLQYTIYTYSLFGDLPEWSYVSFSDIEFYKVEDDYAN